MAPKIFLTGGTGYIGGSVLHTLVSNHPEYEVTALLRTPSTDFAQRYPNVKVVKGDYDSADILTQAASEANIVIHNGNSDHEPSIKALIAGLLKRSEPSFLIHLGGTAIVSDMWTGPYGELNPKAWSDIDNIDEIWSLPDNAFHRNVDKIIQETWTLHGEKIKTAIVCPPDIYGKGHGPGRTDSYYVPFFYEEVQKLGATFYTGSGTNTRSWVHIDDLMKVYLKLVEAAAAGGASAGWGREGYYFAASQEASQFDTAKAAGKILKSKGVLASEEPKQLSLEQVDGMMTRLGFPVIARYMFASNSRTRADRARKVLGYEPTALSFWETLENDLSIALTAGPKKWL